MRCIAFIVFLTGAVTDAQAANLTFHGSFAEVESGAAACDDIFAVTDYETKHFFLGAAPAIVTHFTPVGGFFDGLLFVSNLGYQNDFLYQRDVVVNGITYAVEMYGFLDTGFVHLQTKVSRLEGDAIVCTASANFTGFP